MNCVLIRKCFKILFLKNNFYQSKSVPKDSPLIWSNGLESPKKCGISGHISDSEACQRKNERGGFRSKSKPIPIFFFLVYNMSSKKALIDSYLGGLLFLLFFLASLINNKKGKSSKNVLHHTNYLS